MTTKSKSTPHQKYTCRDGQTVPGVTTALNVLNKPALVPWAWGLGKAGIDLNAARQKALDTGTYAHYLVECEIKGEKPDPEYTREFAPADVAKAETAFLAFLDWQKGSEAVLQWSEAQLVSEQYRYGGTLDIIGKVKGVTTLIDLKAANGIYLDYHYQVAAYEQLWNEAYPDNPIVDVLILRLGKEDGGFEVKPVPKRELCFAVFLHCLGIYKLQKDLR
ncbi:MAG: hypothetical protein WC683_20100 [bacterium]